MLKVFAKERNHQWRGAATSVQPQRKTLKIIRPIRPLDRSLPRRAPVVFASAINALHASGPCHYTTIVLLSRMYTPPVQVTMYAASYKAVIDLQVYVRGQITG